MEEPMFNNLSTRELIQLGVFILLVAAMIVFLFVLLIRGARKAYKYWSLKKTIAALPALPEGRWLELREYASHPLSGYHEWTLKDRLQYFLGWHMDRTCAVRNGHVVAFLAGKVYIALLTYATQQDLQDAWFRLSSNHWVPIMGKGTQIEAKPVQWWGRVLCEVYPVLELTGLGWTDAVPAWKRVCDHIGHRLDQLDLGAERVTNEHGSMLLALSRGFWRYMDF